ncbi:MAG: hypothetical protein HKN25_01505, partial [Pyrinomonadaceae bacterium]|nr:hypothetical protein [Pyrinomonadaceae bacterium]
GNIVYNKAPGFLKQAEFYLGETEFKTAVRAFLKDHEYNNAEWSDLVSAFERSSGKDLKNWADVWVKKRGLPIVRLKRSSFHSYKKMGQPHDTADIYSLAQENVLGEESLWQMKTRVYLKFDSDRTEVKEVTLNNKARNPKNGFARYWVDIQSNPNFKPNTPKLVFPNYNDHGYGIFLLDFRSRKYVLENIKDEKDDFLRSMMWGALWDSVRFAELDPMEYINLALNNIDVEEDVTTISSILGRVNTAFTYYLSDARQKEIAPRLEKLLIEKMRSGKTQGERITFYRAFLSAATSEKSRNLLKELLKSSISSPTVKEGRKDTDKVTPASKRMPDLAVGLPKLRTRDKFDIAKRLIILGDKDASNLLDELEKTEKGDAAKRYAYAAKAGFATKENKAKYWNDFINNKEISESWIEAASRVWNSPRHSKLTLPYLEKALAELPNHKQNRKIFFVNGWVASFIGGQKGVDALEKINNFLVKNPGLDLDLKRKILERVDGLERAVKIREKYSK